MTWQPIETAPEDGTDILGYDPNVECHPRAVVKWLDDRWMVVHDFEGYTWSDYVPTHWMPLPDPPGGKGGYGMNTTEDECAVCGSTLEEVRLGKWQCNKCELDQMEGVKMNELKIVCGKCGSPFPTHTPDCEVVIANRYQAGLAKAQRDNDDAFWLNTFAGMALQGLMVGVEEPRYEIIAMLAVKQAKALLEEVKR